MRIYQRTPAQERIYELVKEKPGITSYELGRRLWGNGSGVLKTLVAMEQTGLLLSEIEQGGLFVWEAEE